MAPSLCTSENVATWHKLLAQSTPVFFVVLQQSLRPRLFGWEKVYFPQSGTINFTPILPQPSLRQHIECPQIFLAPVKKSLR
jgi:hypothetical protein